jgi:hypothetical protein
MNPVPVVVQHGLYGQAQTFPIAITEIHMPSPRVFGGIQTTLTFPNIYFNLTTNGTMNQHKHLCILEQIFFHFHESDFAL